MNGICPVCEKKHELDLVSINYICKDTEFAHVVLNCICKDTEFAHVVRGNSFICPDCGAPIKKANVQNEEGDWSVHWLCGCKVDQSIIESAEKVRANNA